MRAGDCERIISYDWPYLDYLLNFSFYHSFDEVRLKKSITVN